MGRIEIGGHGMEGPVDGSSGMGGPGVGGAWGWADLGWETRWLGQGPRGIGCPTGILETRRVGQETNVHLKVTCL